MPLSWAVCRVGGMNTAGLGGVGGPYRLDGGNAVYQVSDFDKSQVPEEVTTCAFHVLHCSHVVLFIYC